MHWYIATRLVLEGGFSPSDITPRPPFRVQIKRASGKRVRAILHYDESQAGSGERSVLGGLKTKKVDVVVSLDGVGPCVAISLKGTLNAFRNLTNRLEEAVGDCTNVHIAYPALVYAFVNLLRAKKEGPVLENGKNFLIDSQKGNTEVLEADIAIRSDGRVSNSVARYHDALARLAGRKDMRNDITRYESMALVLVSPDDSSLGMPIDAFPSQASPLHFDQLFRNIYEQYDLRFVYGAPNLARTTRRLAWDPDSPALQHPCVTGFDARVAAAGGIPEEPSEAEPVPEEPDDAGDGGDES
jgi:hypothetical protein